jgi:hypothetical protein
VGTASPARHQLDGAVARHQRLEETAGFAPIASSLIAFHGRDRFRACRIVRHLIDDKAPRITQARRSGVVDWSLKPASPLGDASYERDAW